MIIKCHSYSNIECWKDNIFYSEFSSRKVYRSRGYWGGSWSKSWLKAWCWCWRRYKSGSKCWRTGS